MTLVVIRHLPTLWNRCDRLQGRRDIEIEPPDAALTTEIENNRRRLNELGPFDKVMCSTLRRTAQTAALYQYECGPDALLDEFDFGIYEGQNREKFMSEMGDQWINRPQDLVLGESMAALEQRIRQFLAKYRVCSRVLVFGHGGWIRALKSIYETGGVNEMNRRTIANNSVLVFSFPDAASLEK